MLKLITWFNQTWYLFNYIVNVFQILDQLIKISWIQMEQTDNDCREFCDQKIWLLKSLSLSLISIKVPFFSLAIIQYDMSLWSLEPCSRICRNVQLCRLQLAQLKLSFISSFYICNLHKLRSIIRICVGKCYCNFKPFSHILKFHLLWIHVLEANNNSLTSLV